MLTKLLTGKSYIKLEELAKDLYVSKSTVHLLMKDVTELLLPYNLTIERRPYHGIRVKGDEISLRSCISQYLLPRDVHVPLLENEYESVGISDLHRIRDTVLKCIEQTNVYLSDLELDNLVIHIAIAIRRLKEQHYIQSFRLNLREIAETREYEIAENITGYLEKELHISFPKEEIFTSPFICWVRASRPAAWEVCKMCWVIPFIPYWRRSCRRSDTGWGWISSRTGNLCSGWDCISKQ